MLFGERVQSGHHDDDGMGWFQLLLGTCTLSLRVAVCLAPIARTGPSGVTEERRRRPPTVHFSMPSKVTVNTRVAFGGTTPPAPASP